MKTESICTTGKTTIGVVDMVGKKWLGIATRKSKLIDMLTMGYYPKPRYQQIGTFHGDTIQFKCGDKVLVLLKEKESFFDFLLGRPNIIKLEKIN